MRITIRSPPVDQRGDVEPYVALGVGLRRGHEVCVATHADFEGLIAATALPFSHWKKAAGPSRRTTRVTGCCMPATTPSPSCVTSRPAPAVGAQAAAPLLARLPRGRRDSFHGHRVPLAEAVAERGHLPVVWTSLMPLAPSRFQASCLFSPWPSSVPGSSVYNLMTHAMTGWGMWLLLGRALNRARRDVLGLPPVPIYGPIASYLAPRLCLDGYGADVAPPPPDWGVRHHVTGYGSVPRLDQLRVFCHQRGLARLLNLGRAVCVFGAICLATED